MSIDHDTYSLGYLLKLAQHSLRLHMDDMLRGLELTTPQYAVLSQLEIKPGISNAALARASFITPQTMHGIISNLERRELLTRKQHSGHGRVISTELTKKGRSVVKQAHKAVRGAEEFMTQGLAPREQLILRDLLGSCILHLRR